jgi:hypothetical protein
VLKAKSASSISTMDVNNIILNSCNIPTFSTKINSTTNSITTYVSSQSEWSVIINKLILFHFLLNLPIPAVIPSLCFTNNPNISKFFVKGIPKDATSYKLKSFITKKSKIYPFIVAISTDKNTNLYNRKAYIFIKN